MMHQSLASSPQGTKNNVWSTSRRDPNVTFPQAHPSKDQTWLKRDQPSLMASTNVSSPKPNVVPSNKSYCFVSPIMSKEEVKNVENFFLPSDDQKILLAKDLYTHAFVKQTSFCNDPKTTFRGVELFRTRFDRLHPTKGKFWKDQGWYDLMWLSRSDIDKLIFDD
ncbi:hypothetical protein PIB30_061055 [Stylosanthes scabra]|uniref:Uncharacterized protein n=1 Tax=Stylosanthes scabra TaxID=79078 RepID=A0ABU6UPD8_9FABA|nr:hypothetical protein [Stylosanthes scabra]